jgi:pimeloyl-ACP methyl ester carboxylesterase
VLIVLPGLDGTGRRLGPFIGHLPLDLPARLLTYPPDVALGYAELEARVRHTLPAGSRHVLLAESFSGPLAVRIAAHPPPGLAGVILCGSFVRNPFPALGWAAPVVSRVPFKGLPRWLRKRLFWNTGDATAAPPEKDRASATVAAAVLRHRLREVLSVDAREALSAVRLPLLVLEAQRDRIVRRGATRTILAAATQARHVVIDGPHLLLQTRPAECATAVGEFLRTLLR